jgi:Peptidase A4 family
MRHKWPVLATAIPLMFGWALIAASPAGATPRVAGSTDVFAATGVFGASRVSGVSGVFGSGGWVQPGGLASQLGRPSAGGGPRATGRTAQSTGPTVVTSSNWAGYADTGPSGDFTDVTSSWVQPAGHCSSGDQYAAFWVGLDGYSSRTVEQIGSEVDCVGQTPEYSAWYEIYPSPEVAFSNPVQAGDQLFASVSYEGSNKFRLTITDSTEHWKRSATRRLAGAARSSAEVIAEAPCCTDSGGILPLTDFGTASFSAATVNNADLCTLAPVEITMPDTSVSSLSNCQNFTASYTGSRGGSPFPVAGGGF